MRKYTNYIILLFLAFQIQIFSQISEEIKNKNLVLIVKNDGREFIGEIISDDGREILVVTKAIGKIFINKSDISSITKVDEDSENKEISIDVFESKKDKCDRCWHHTGNLKQLLDSNLCPRCIENIEGEGEKRKFF